MRRRTRVIVLAACLTVTAASLALWLATGAAMFTRFYDPALARHRQSEREVDRLLVEAGAEPATDSHDHPPNKFQFGLLPSTDLWHLWCREALSVLTLAGPLVLAMLPMVVRRRRD